MVKEKYRKRKRLYGDARRQNHVMLRSSVGRHFIIIALLKALTVFKRPTSFFIFILSAHLFFPSIAQAALNIHRNFGEDLVTSIKNHVYIDHSYVVPRRIAQPTCNSLDGVACSFLLLQSKDHTNAVGKGHFDLNYQDDLISSSTHFQDNKNRWNKELPVLAHSERILTPDTTEALSRRSIPIFEDGTGDDSDSETFGNTLGDGISWLISRQGVFDRVWDMEKARQESDDPLHTSSSLQMTSEEPSAVKHDSLYEMLLSSLQTQPPTIGSEERETESGYWWDPSYWWKRLDRFAEKIADFILADFDLDEENESSSAQGGERDTASREAPFSENSKTKRPRGKNSINQEDQFVGLSWEGVTKVLDFSQVPLETTSIPEFYGSSSFKPFDVSIRWKGDWRIGINRDRPLCSHIGGADGSIFFSKPVVISEVAAKWMFTNQNNPILEETHNNDSIITENQKPTTEDTLRFSPDTVSSQRLLSETPTRSHDKTTPETRQYQRVVVEGWFWNSSARRMFLDYLESQGEPKTSEAWFYSTLPVDAFSQGNMTRVWSVDIDLRLAEDGSFLKPQDWNSGEFNVIDRIIGSPYLRVDGVTFNYRVARNQSRLGYSQSSDTVFNIQNSLISGDPFFKSNPSDILVSLSGLPGSRKPINRNSRLRDGPSICLQRLTIHRPMVTFSQTGHQLMKPDIDQAAWETLAVKAGVILRESDDGSIRNELQVESRNDISVKPLNPKMLDVQDRQRHIAVQNQITTEQRKKYQKTHSDRITQPVTPAPPFGRPIAPRVLPNPTISSDGILLSQDWRDSMKKIEVILQRDIPVESPAVSFTDLHESEELVLRKPSSSSIVLFSSPRSSHPGRLGHGKQGNGKSNDDTLSNEIREFLKNSVDDVSDSDMVDHAETELTLLKRKLMEAAKSSLESVRRTHEISHTTRQLEEEPPRSLLEGSEVSPLPTVQQPIAVVRSHVHSRSLPEENWENLSGSIGSEVSASLLQVLQEHQLNVQEEAQRLGLPDEINRSLFKSIHVIELLQKDGEVVAKRLKLDLTDDNKGQHVGKEQLGRDDTRTENVKETLINGGSDPRRTSSQDGAKLPPSVTESTNPKAVNALRMDQKNDLLKLLEENPDGQVFVNEDGIAHVSVRETTAPNSISSTQSAYSVTDSRNTISSSTHSYESYSPQMLQQDDEAELTHQEIHERVHAEMLRRHDEIVRTVHQQHRVLVEQ